ncbi:hypothetical protein AURDEDRAFT_90575 [Auricularia subglabra TFB-10046 SS5]|nr:hypothetical protein AURDEDRAFT_90575 [Auricularia subglabra TFB-10046 SS5]
MDAMYDLDQPHGNAYGSAPIASGSAAPARSTRSATGALKSGKPPPKLKLKLGDKSGPYASGMSFMGPYDRELDSDGEEDLVFEEQFILRVPAGKACDRIRSIAQDRLDAPDVSFKFRDSRRGAFVVGNHKFEAKLVDLPCIIEAQKTLDRKNMFKVADISQMLVLEPENTSRQQHDFKVDEFIWPHGITPPLHHVRKRRFRKRINRRTIETVEQEVERLLEADAAADSVQYTVLEGVNPDLSDSEFLERDEFDPQTPLPADGDAPTPLGEADEAEEEQPDEAEDEDAMDAELAAELHRAMDGGSSAEEDGADESEASEEEDAEDDDDEEGEDDEFEVGRKRLNEEIRDLEAAVAKKHSEIASSVNPLLKKRFEDALRKLQADVEMKYAQRDAIAEERARRKEMNARAEKGEAMDVDVEEEEEPEDDGEMEAAAVQVFANAQQMDDDVDPLFGPDDG